MNLLTDEQRAVPNEARAIYAGIELDKERINKMRSGMTC